MKWCIKGCIRLRNWQLQDRNDNCNLRFLYEDRYYYNDDPLLKDSTWELSYHKPKDRIEIDFDYFIKNIVNFPEKWCIQPKNNYEFLVIKEWLVKNDKTCNWGFYKINDGRYITSEFTWRNEPLVLKDKGYIEINFHQFTTNVLKEQGEIQMTKEIIGYKLIKKEYAEAVLKIEGHQFIGTAIKEDQILESKHTESVEKLKKAGVLDLWFEPVYKQEDFKIGDWVWVVKTEPGAYGIENKAAILTEEKATTGLSKVYPTGVNVKYGDSVWCIGKDYSSVKLRKATPEEIKQHAFIRHSVGGMFKVTISSKGIYHDISNITDFVKDIVSLKNTNFAGGYTYCIENIVFSKTGCQNQITTLKDWLEVWKIFSTFESLIIKTQ